MEELKRPSPEELLSRLKDQREKEEGPLKIFFGYAAGVGKTYAMLEAARRAKSQGIDVAVGYIEPHTRPETMALLEGLETLPVRSVGYRGLKLDEFDLDGALARHPKLILVDELAHTNAPGSRHVKRYQDIKELLRAGIDVYTTVNVQHIESLNDIVASITGVTVAERVPDDVFDRAELIEVIDLEPDDLIERIESGKVYKNERAKRALGGFFTKKNLGALREITLRRTADKQSRAAMAEGGGINAGEHVLTCLSAAPSNAKVIRTAARLAEAFHSRFTALYVETGGGRPGDGGGRRLQMNIKLAEDLGAQIVTAYGDDIAGQIAQYASQRGVTKAVLGRTNHKNGLFGRKKSLIDRLTETAPELDVYIIPDRQPPYRAKKQYGGGGLELSWRDTAYALLIFAAATLFSYVFFRAGFQNVNTIAFYMLAVLFTSLLTRGYIYGAALSFASVAAFNYLFIEPLYSFTMYDPAYPVVLIVMLCASLLAGSLAARIKKQAELASGSAYMTEVLLETSRLLNKSGGFASTAEVAERQLRKLLDRPVFIYGEAEPGRLARISPVKLPKEERAYESEEEMGVAEWVRTNNRRAGAATETLPGAKCLYMAVRGGDGKVLAVAAIAAGPQPPLTAFEKNLIRAMLDECDVALEKALLYDRYVPKEGQSDKDEKSCVCENANGAAPGGSIPRRRASCG